MSGVLLLGWVLTIFGFLTSLGAKIIEPMLEVRNRYDEKNEHTKGSNKIRSNNRSYESYPNNDGKGDDNKEWLKDQIENYKNLTIMILDISYQD